MGLREALRQREVVFAPLCLDALTARIAAEAGFDAGYLSGGALGYAHAVSEALLTLDELVDVARHITARSELPLIVDGGVGFGDPVHVTRMIEQFELAGAAAVEIEDQVAPKRVSHHRGIEHLIDLPEMVAKIEHAVAVRRSPDFLIIARTGAVRNESFDRAIERGVAYRAAGADLIMLMPETDDQRQRAPHEIDAPLATIAPLDGRTPQQWQSLGWRLVVDPFTAQVLAVDSVRRAYRDFVRTGHTGNEVGKLLATYRQLPDLAGLQRLFDIESTTTER